MDNFEITKVNSNEITSLQKVGRQTFFETFSQTPSQIYFTLFCLATSTAFSYNFCPIFFP